MENKTTEIKEETFTIKKEDFERMAMALNQIQVTGVANVMNLATVFDVLNNKTIVNK